MAAIEIVPNLSEGRDARKVARLVDVLRVPGVRVLDASSDPDHHRSVLTAIGEPSVLISSLLSLATVAYECFDLREHEGAHPRLGVVDVVPFVPLGEDPIEAAVAAARAFAERLGRELEVPVFLYAEADRAGGRRPFELRRLGLEGVRSALREGRLRADFGPVEVDPARGVVLVGARRALVAFNVMLEDCGLAAARTIAAGLRESGGGLAGVQAMAFALPRRGCVQVSTNVFFPFRTSLWQVLAHVEREAIACGARVRGPEVVGLVPEDALRDAGGEVRLLPGLEPESVLERRLTAG